MAFCAAGDDTLEFGDAVFLSQRFEFLDAFFARDEDDALHAARGVEGITG